jgi:hypothetical protein
VKIKQVLFLFLVGILGWIVPGGGYFAINRKKHAFIIFFTIVITFTIGLYIGSVSVIDPAGSRPWFAAQMMNTPAVAAIGYFLPKNGNYVYGRPGEIGQIYTSITGLLNLLCIVNAVYLAHLIATKRTAGE